MVNHTAVHKMKIDGINFNGDNTSNKSTLIDTNKQCALELIKKNNKVTA